MPSNDILSGCSSVESMLRGETDRYQLRTWYIESMLEPEIEEFDRVWVCLEIFKIKVANDRLISRSVALSIIETGGYLLRLISCGTRKARLWNSLRLALYFEEVKQAMSLV
jgi:hypothetical protein